MPIFFEEVEEFEFKFFFSICTVDFDIENFNLLVVTPSRPLLLPIHLKLIFFNINRKMSTVTSLLCIYILIKNAFEKMFVDNSMKYLLII